MVNSRIVCLLSVAFVVLGSAARTKPKKAQGVKRCPEAHPFAWDVGRRCCSVAQGNRFEAWAATSCEGENEYQYCYQQPGHLCDKECMHEYENSKPCENFKVDCTDDTECPQGYGMCVGGSCTTMCPGEMFLCKVSNFCIDKSQMCNGYADCGNAYEFSWNDDSDETGCDAASPIA